MKRLAILMAYGLMAVTGFGAVSTQFTLDCQSGTRTITNGTEYIAFSPAWVTNAASATATVAINGTAVTNATAAGDFLWTPTRNGTYLFTHTVAVDGADVGEVLNATFKVTGFGVVIKPDSGTTFNTSLTVNISCAAEGATIHFTTNGTTPTAESPVYKRFKIYGRTTVKAIAAFADGSVSGVTTVEYAKGTVATPVITVPTSFSGSKTTATITCDTDDAVIRYTLDGSEPSAQSPIYEDVIVVTASCTIRARAFRTDYFDSAGSAATVTKVFGIGDAMNDPDRKFTTDAEHGWEIDEVVNHDGEASMRSGELKDSEEYGEYVTSTLSTTVSGPGTVHFWWKASCEDDPEWDHGEFLVDGETVTNIFGETEWRQFAYTFDTDGEHAIDWKYLKDDFGSEGSDCIWVDEFHWTPAYTTSTEVPVPGSWIDKYYPNTFDYEAAAKRLAANGVNSVEDAYVAGLDPTNAASVFTASVTFSNGMVYVSWTPYLNTGDLTRIYTISGRTDLVSGDWEILQPYHRFFKTAVSMPTGAAGETSAVPGEGFVPTDGGVQLWENGPYWAECNVGATKPEEYGYYFWWGDTVGYKRSGGTWTDDWYYSGVTWVSSTGTSMSSSPFDYSTCPTYGKSNSELQSLGYIDSTGNLTAAHDAATAHLGSLWRMPTATEIDALISNCTTTWMTTNGVYGRLVTGKGAYASKSIFLPAAGGSIGSRLDHTGSTGSYLSSTPSSPNPSSDLYTLVSVIHFISSNFCHTHHVRYCGLSVRALREFAK